ncbi:T9SS type A sorting domain-containing protein [bacterium]|nr:T9SS type A sorting domain-containing protein [bacterium]
MHYLIIILILSSAGFARVKPIENEFQKPHSTWQHRPLQFRNFTSTLDEFQNLRINTDGSGQIQNEEQCVINPLNPDNMVAVWRDFREGYRRVGVGYTLDGGATWSDALFPQMYYEWASDPVLLVDHNGVFTAMVISFEAGGEGDNGMLQVSSYDGGVTWRDSVWAVLTTDESAFEDKEMLAVDASPDSPYQGSFYCVWAHFFRNAVHGGYDSTHCWIVRKRPDSLYSAPIQLSTRRSLQWPNVATGPNGEVYCTWVCFPHDSIKFARSLDGGVTFTPERGLFHVNMQQAEIDPSLLVFSYMALAVDNTNGPHRGRLYGIFTDTDAQFTDTDVFFTYSDNQGTSWSNPVRVDDENAAFAVDQFHPWITVDDSGRVWCAWYDRRNDPSNLLMDLYFTYSEDGGATWEPDQRISEVSSNPGAGTLDAGLIGEYVGFAAAHNKALAVWTDTRNGNQDAYAAVIDSLFIEDAVGPIPSPIPHPPSPRAWPNPFNGSTSLSYSLSAPSEVSLSVFNTLGQLVLSRDLGQQQAGAHSVSLDLIEPSGVYFAKLTSRTQSQTAKLLLMR